MLGNLCRITSGINYLMTLEEEESGRIKEEMEVIEAKIIQVSPKGWTWLKAEWKTINLTSGLYSQYHYII